MSNLICENCNTEFAPKDMGNVSDGYHTFNELYEFRMVYNAAFFNELYRTNKCRVVKSWRHHDGEECFGGGWFIVMAFLPTGQISNHYEAKHWDLFQCTIVDKCDEWDGHTATDVLQRMKDYTTNNYVADVCEESIYFPEIDGL